MPTIAAIVIKNGKVVICGDGDFQATDFPAIVDFSDGKIVVGSNSKSHGSVKGYNELLVGHPIPALRTSMSVIYEKGTPKLYYNLSIDGLQHQIDVETVLIALLSHAESLIPNISKIVLSVPQWFTPELQQAYSSLVQNVTVQATIGEMDGIAQAYRNSAKIGKNLIFAVIDATPMGLCIGTYKVSDNGKVTKEKFVKASEINEELLMEAKDEFFEAILSEVFGKPLPRTKTPDRKLQVYADAVFRTYRDITKGVKIQSVALHSDIFVKQAVQDRLTDKIKHLEHCELVVARGILTLASSFSEIVPVPKPRAETHQ